MNMPESGAASADGPALGAGFPAATRERWRELVAGVLAKTGVDVDSSAHAPEELLASATYDGFTIGPLYVAEDEDDQVQGGGFPGLAPFTRGRRPEGAVTSGWDIRQQHVGPDPAATRKAVLADLENGVTSLWLAAGDQGVPVAGIGEALADVHLDLAPVVLDPGPDTDDAAAAEALLTAWSDRDIPDTAVSGNLGIDPISRVARTAVPDDAATAAADIDAAARLAASHAARYPGLRLITVDGTPYHDAGGSDAQELGATMAAGVAYLRALTDAGLDLADAAARLEFRYAATADQFATIAKLRAARAMWARVAEVCGLPAEQRGMRQHAATSAAMMTRRDPYVNMLRTTLACFGAGTGGADAVTVRPFDAALGLPDDFARRIARNTQSLLLEEAHLARVIDPAGGSFFVERLTADLYTAGWAFFQELEAAGGMAAALTSGLVAQRVDEVWQKRRDNLAHRRDPVTGVSEFPDLDEPRVERSAAPGAVTAPSAPTALPRHRYAEDFEALRDRSDAHLDATGERPRVFLATLGPVAAHTARVTFAANLLQAGGIEPVPGGDDVAAAVAAFRDSGARVACLCSSDKVYSELAADAAAALKEAGAEKVLLAGKPAERYAAAGVDAFLFAGCDAHSLLVELHDVLGCTQEGGDR
ncbi:methylmalonyl-CoA mutase [Nocardiopsis gilva YIM 90087]|uniref:methylmalonyl-CoA mutase n=2 Tax=Nocardiopsis gilva TaxID=280236 RepID=A0A223S1T8_9ACTN|nr:methylmalonyl-CoA mutase subunit beta [Nocardiopsis gilva]ASU82093.1 methylmalonyl-CoA mutase [Nocardiopsis gilva YIM 90087]